MMARKRDARADRIMKPLEVCALKRGGDV